MEDPEEVDELEEEIDALERSHPGSRRRIEELGEVVRVTSRLWQAREHLGITVEEVAERGGLTLDEVELVEDNAVDCPFIVLCRYAKAVGIQFALQPMSAS
jgi:hypothetical protein